LYWGRIESPYCGKYIASREYSSNVNVTLNSIFLSWARVGGESTAQLPEAWQFSSWPFSYVPAMVGSKPPLFALPFAPRPAQLLNPPLPLPPILLFARPWHRGLLSGRQFSPQRSPLLNPPLNPLLSPLLSPLPPQRQSQL
jgi:hypothetical protein